MTRAEELAQVLMLCPMVAEGICCMPPQEFAQLAIRALIVLQKKRKEG
jgi:hypothetical protein